MLNKKVMKFGIQDHTYCNKTINKERHNKEELNHYIDFIFKAVKLATHKEN